VIQHDDLSSRGYSHIADGYDQDCSVCRTIIEIRAGLTKVMQDIAAAMPWYDDATPDYSEAEEVIRDFLLPYLSGRVSDTKEDP